MAEPKPFRLFFGAFSRSVLFTMRPNCRNDDSWRQTKVAGDFPNVKEAESALESYVLLGKELSDYVTDRYQKGGDLDRYDKQRAITRLRSQPVPQPILG